MGRSSDIETSVRNGLSDTLDVRSGRVVPEATDIGPREGVELDATYLYADMGGSSKLAHHVLREAAAKVLRAYVNTATQILNYWDGEIRSFDGDRVMAIFIGDNRNRAATRAALEINWAVKEVIWPLIQERWNDVDKWGWRLTHGVGIDTGEALLVRGGVRSDNDIISVGRAPNVAAKLSELRDYCDVYITDTIFNDLNDQLTYGPKGEPMWIRLTGPREVGGRFYTVHATTWYWGPA